MLQVEAKEIEFKFSWSTINYLLATVLSASRKQQTCRFLFQSSFDSKINNNNKLIINY